MTSESPRNGLLETLTAPTRDSLLSVAEHVELDYGQVITEPGQPIAYVHFPLTGFVSELFPVEPHANLELALIGKEGMIGLPLVLGVDLAIMQALVQGAGSSLRIDESSFLEKLGKLPELRRQLQRYVHLTLFQFAQSSTCNSFHSLSERLARWLLLSHDRSRHGGSFRLTHKFLAQMLGVRRVGITNAAGLFQEQGLIHYTRGVITVLDPVGLEGVSCCCYRSAKKAYAQIIG